MTEKCNAVCKARKALGNRLQAARVYPRGTSSLPFISKIITERAKQRCDHAGCYLSKATTYELDKAVKNSEIYPWELPTVGKLVLAKQEAQAADLASQEILYKDKMLKAELQSIARKKR
jgi:hypothetical protein